MPEGPELHLASRFINQVCNGRVFGKIAKSEINKNPVVEAPSKAFSITASSRGKEIKLTLHEYLDKEEKPKEAKALEGKRLDILVTFGLAGKFEFVKPTELAKHAHLNFFTDDKQPEMVLSFVDYMRFGKWTPGSDFSYTDRGPCVLTDYTAFREHVLKNLKSSAFNRPICELLLNQRYFNGIGNYLRAEILYRAGVPPFVCGRDVLEPLAGEPVVKSEKADILELCHVLPQEVIALEGSWYDSKDRETLSNSFNRWLQCYYQDNMKNMADHNKRTIWYAGPAGPMAPKETVVRGKVKRKPRQRKKEEKEEQNESEKEEEEATQKSAKKSQKGRKAKSAKKIKLEEDSTEKEAKGVRSADTERDILVMKELTENLHSTRLTRRKLRDIMDQKVKLNDKVKVEEDEIDIKSEAKGQRKQTTKRGRSARKLLNNDAPYLNSAKQNAS